MGELEVLQEVGRTRTFTSLVEKSRGWVVAKAEQVFQKPSQGTKGGVMVSYIGGGGARGLRLLAS